MDIKRFFLQYAPQCSVDYCVNLSCRAADNEKFLKKVNYKR